MLSTAALRIQLKTRDQQLGLCVSAAIRVYSATAASLWAGYLDVTLVIFTGDSLQP